MDLSVLNCLLSSLLSIIDIKLVVELSFNLDYY
jgi:hypothetical protein